MEKARRDCAEKSPLIFDYEPVVRFRKKVIAINFYIKPNEKFIEKPIHEISDLTEKVKIQVNLEPQTKEDLLEREINIAGCTKNIGKFIKRDGLDVVKSGLKIARKEIKEECV